MSENQSTVREGQASRFTGPKPLGPRLARRLLAYATVAGAGFAACHPKAQAEVVYTADHSEIWGKYYIDLNNDGLSDFYVSATYLSELGHLEIIPTIPINKITAVPESCGGNPGAAALAEDAIIGPGMPFARFASCMATLRSYRVNGPWAGERDHYLGFRFYIKGQVHYGWARLSFNSFYCYPCIATLSGYAYETIPEKAIKAGNEGKDSGASVVTEPAMLGALAMGAPGLDLWRKSETPGTWDAATGEQQQ
jgi:hypothetical protein